MPDDVKLTGPMFDGRAVAALTQGMGAIRDHVSATGVRLAAAAFSGRIKDDRGRFLHSLELTTHSGAYTSSSGHHSYTLAVEVPTEAEAVITDLATYGPWLEGVGSRNLVTRFKGYHGFRTATQELGRQAQDIADQAIRPYIERMN